MTPVVYIDQGATFAGEREQYRLQLWRTWRAGGRRALWIMLNPSTADATKLDPTLRRCQAFSLAWGCDGFDVVNLFALRSTKPAALYQHGAPIGRENDRIILAAARESAIVIAAWGKHGAHLNRGNQVRDYLDDAGVALECLGQNLDGSPCHPLYLAAATTRRPFAPRLRAREVLA